MKLKHIVFYILFLLSWFIGYEVFISLNGVIDLLRYSFAYGYSIFSLFIIAVFFINDESKEE